ncbi:RIB43A-like with coiled-coils protein 2 isoform X2 [Pseudophryne corroboree]|uniref:RIB43A-like with coiled-coils protein 2 isoform X2 n=1 Tax=Pseudophryne corroboree TaxID=495146 RepID=UPI0030813487
MTVIYSLCPAEGAVCWRNPNDLMTNTRMTVRKKEEEKQRNTEWDGQRLLAGRAAMTLERQEEELSREIRKRLDQYRQQLSREQKAHQRIPS